MRNLVCMAVAFFLLQGCTLAPQIIQLNTDAEVQRGELATKRNALVRVVDQRDLTGHKNAGTLLGYRGGKDPLQSPLLASDSIQASFTERLSATMRQLGFGAGSSADPIKVQLDIVQLEYQCNDGPVVTKCGIDVELSLKVINQNTTFTKSFSANQQRTVVGPPAGDYNQIWVNQMLDKLWTRMFGNQELRKTLGVQ